MQTTTIQQTTSRVLMVRPVDFAFNEQTAQDNEFQNQEVQNSAQQILQAALDEFAQAVKMLTSAGIQVEVLEKQQVNEPTPDAVFPNNWISTFAKHVIVYPMCTPNRRAETKQFEHARLLLSDSYKIVRLDVEAEKQNLVLEGTGSMILDHSNKRIFASLSARTHLLLLQRVASLVGYSLHAFHTLSSHGKEIYHTNVVMAIGTKFVVICSACIATEQERLTILQELNKYHVVIDISMQQMEQSFCGNILELQCSKTGESRIVMSETAYNGFTKDQLTTLSSFGTIVPIHISTIEKIGGGSARCMLCELF